jgi:hypothetical protein
MYCLKTLENGAYLSPRVDPRAVWLRNTFSKHCRILSKIVYGFSLLRSWKCLNKAVRVFKLWRNSQHCQSVFMSSAHRFPKECALCQESEASPACPFDNSRIKVKMTVEQWWNDTDRGKPNTQRKTSSRATLSVMLLIYIAHEYLDRTSQRIKRSSVTKTNGLMLCRKILSF